MTDTHTQDLYNKEATDKLKSLVDDIKICLFCTKLIREDEFNRWSMAVQQVCNQGYIWFLSKKDSDKNKDISSNEIVQLYFSSPGKSNYVIVSGEAEIIINHVESQELWTPLVKTWLKEGIIDANLSIIKVKPTTVYYWDNGGNQIINF